MADLTTRTRARIYPGSEITTLARLVKADGTLISSSDLSSARLQVYNRTDPTTAIIIGALSATGIVVATSTATNTLSTGSGWDLDESGHNFAHTYDTSTFLSGGNEYIMDYKITTSSLGIMHVIVDLSVQFVPQA